MRGGSDGWIGHWSPGIGDPTPMGWLTVCFYLLAAWLCYRVTVVALRAPASQERAEQWLWYALGGGLLLLGINKQLDLQSAMTEVGRLVATHQGWYESRRAFQAWFIALIGALALVAGVMLALMTRKMPASTRITATGCLLLLAFVIIRAASFHHADVLISHAAAGLKVNWILEIGSLLIIGAGAIRRARSRHHAGGSGPNRLAPQKTLPDPPVT